MVSAGAPKRSQAERLTDAMIELCAGAGYQAVSVAQVSSRASVSSATFYELFDGKEGCLLAAYRACRERVLDRMRPISLEGASWSDASRAMLDALVSGLQSDPDAGRILFVESLAGGQRMREERDRTLAAFEHGVAGYLDSRPADEQTLDIPVAALEGARRNIVSRCLRTQSEDRLPLLIDDLVRWMACYAIPAERERWSRSSLALLPPAPVPGPANGDGGPARLPRGRHGLPPGVVTRSQRSRILYGTGEAMMANGYANATVADIVAAAGVSRDVFYEHFTNKQQAFLEAQHYATQHIFDTCAAAYFAGKTWPERVWNAMDALIGLIAANPANAHLRVVECYAAGPTAIRSTENILRAAGFFLEEGYAYREQAHKLPRLCSQAITGAVFEIIYRHLARTDVPAVQCELPQLVYIAIAPFVGQELAVELIEQMVARRLGVGEP